MHLAYVQERQCAVEAAGENNADSEISVETNSDAVLQRGPHVPCGLADVGDGLFPVAHAQQVDVCGDGWIPFGAAPSVVAWRDFTDSPSRRDERLQFRCRVQVTVVARPIERFHPERVTSQVDPVGSLVNDGECELASQPVHRTFPPLEERLQDHFGVAVTPQHVAPGGKL